MARLTQAERDALPESAFAGPDRSYPVTDAQGNPDPNHAALAKGMAKKYTRGQTKDEILAKANQVLARRKGR